MPEIKNSLITTILNVMRNGNDHNRTVLCGYDRKERRLKNVVSLSYRFIPSAGSLPDSPLLP
jgi:hypothetical protein